MKLWVMAPAVIVLATSAVTPASAQSMRDAVKDHVKQGLDERKPDPQKNAQPAKKTPPPPRPVESGAPPEHTWSFSTNDPPPPPVANPLPRRIIGDYLRLDFKIDGAYRGWLPQQYDTAQVKVGGYYTYSLEVRGKLFKYVNLHRGYYESNALTAPRTNEAAVAAMVGAHLPKAAWLLAMVGVPISRAWEPMIRYESRAFNTTATPQIPLCIVPRDAADDLSDCPRTTDTLRIVSAVETLTLGVRFDPAKQGGPVIADQSAKRVPPLFFGIGLMSYTKPYQVTVNGNTLGDYLFDGRFRGAGLALGTNVGGGVRQLFVDADVQLGLGEVQLTNTLTLNELTPDDWLIGYVQGTVTAGYRFVLIEGPPTIFFTPVASGGGASFHFFRTSGDGGTGRTPSLNWDFLWSVRAALEIAI